MTPKPSQPKGLRILFADDEEALQDTMSLELPRLGHQVTVCPDGPSAVRELEAGQVFDCLLVDLDMPGMNGLEVIRRFKEVAPETEAIVLTGKQTLATAVEAMRYGACDYLTKPCRLVELKDLLNKIALRRDSVKKFYMVKRQLEQSSGCPQLVGDHPLMHQVRQLVAKVAPTNSTVLIRGETGCGKELVARSVHDQSLRKDKPFVAINCGALPENLIESELFGHKKGAFTGPIRIAKDSSKSQAVALSFWMRSVNYVGRSSQAVAGAGKRRYSKDRRKRIDSR